MLNPLDSITDTLKQRGKPIQSDFKQIYRRADGIMEYFLWGYFAFGLGLAPFYGSWLVAVGMGGVLSVDSVLGQGSTFTLTLSRGRG